LKIKAPLYARHGIPEVWIVDINGKQLHSLREPTDDGYKTIHVIQHGVLEIATLPGVQIDLSEVLSF